MEEPSEVSVAMSFSPERDLLLKVDYDDASTALFAPVVCRVHKIAIGELIRSAGPEIESVR